MSIYHLVLDPFSFEAHMQIDQNSAITNNKPKVSNVNICSFKLNLLGNSLYRY